MHETRPRSRASPAHNVFLDRKTILNTDAYDKSQHENRGIRLSEQHNQIVSQHQRET